MLDYDRFSQSRDFIKSCPSFLALQQIFKFASLGKSVKLTLPKQHPRTFTFSPLRETVIVLLKTTHHVFSDTNVVLLGSLTLKDVAVVEHALMVAGQRSRMGGIMSRHNIKW